MSVFLNEECFEAVIPVYMRLSAIDLLKKCMKGLTQNANEAFHSVLWNKCSKNSASSKDRLEIAAAHAVSEYNLGHSNSARLMNEELSVNALKICAAKDKTRKRKSDLQIGTVSKQRRIAKKSSRNKTESSRARAEGATYGAGAF